MLNTEILYSEESCNKHNIKKRKLREYDIGICIKCEDDKRRIDSLNHQKAYEIQIIESRLKSIKRPIRHEKCCFKNFHIAIEGQKYAFEQAVAYAQNVCTGKSSNMIFLGKTGTGKTHLACAISEYLIQFKSKNLSVRYATSDSVVTEVMNSWTKVDSTESSVISEFTKYDLLIIDEFGLHDINQSNDNKKNHKIDILQKVINARYDHMKSILIISNLDQQMIKNSIGDRCWSRLHEDHLSVVHFNWFDHRLNIQH